LNFLQGRNLIGFRADFEVLQAEGESKFQRKTAAVKVAYSSFKSVVVKTWSVSQLLFILNPNNYVMVIGIKEQ